MSCILSKCESLDSGIEAELNEKQGELQEVLDGERKHFRFGLGEHFVWNGRLSELKARIALVVSAEALC